MFFYIDFIKIWSKKIKNIPTNKATRYSLNKWEEVEYVDQHLSYIGVTRKGKFWLSLATGLFALTFLIGFFGFSGTFFAMPLGGMGDFHVSFKKLEGTGFTLSPHFGETGNASDVPMVRNQIQSATIENLHIYKDLKLPTGDWIRINVRTDEPAKVEGLIQDARFIEANIQFTDLAVEQANTTNVGEDEAYRKNWSQQASTVMIYDAKIVTDYLFQNMVSLQSAEISIEFIDDPDLIDDDDSATGEAPKGNDGQGGKGEGESNDSLPKTATNHWSLLAIGSFLLMTGLVFAFKRKRVSKIIKE